MTKDEYAKFARGVVKATRGLIAKVPADRLDWRPDPSFLTMGSVVRHVAETVGEGLKAVMDGGWGIHFEGGGGGLPPAEAFPSVRSVQEGLDLIDADWKLFEERFAKVDEKTLNAQVVKIPWMAPETTLAEYMLHTVEHLSNHRMQLFLYLRLIGLKVNTATLYGGGD